MSQYNMNHSTKQYKLNVISKHSEKLKISIVVGGGLTISHLKRKIQTQFSQLYNIEIVIKVIEDRNGFIISNNSTVQQHFSSGDTIYFTQHGQSQKKGYSMNMASNLGEILSTVRFMTASALEKLDKIDLSNANVMELMADLLHMGFWHENTLIVQKLFHIFNKIFGQASIEKFMVQATQLQMSMMIKNFMFWLAEVPNSTTTQKQIIWELMQLLQKFSYNEKFNKIMKNHKLLKIVVQISKDGSVSGEVKKMCVGIVKNINGGKVIYGNSKIQSEYMPNVFTASDVNGYRTEDILNVLSKGSPDEKITVLEQLAQTNFEGIAEGTVRFDYYQKLVNIFTIRAIKSKKHVVYFNQAVNLLSAQTSKEQCVQIMQGDILKKIHSFMLESPIETHPVCIEYLEKLCKLTAGAGMFNIEKGLELMKTPYSQFQKLIIMAISMMSEKLANVSALRFIPGIKDYITLCLKSGDERIIVDLLKILSNLSLDEGCRYQIINLKGMEVLIKFLQTSKNQEICRVASKGLLNLGISSRENKAKVLSFMNGIIEKFYRNQFDSITSGYIETILKSKNV